MSPAPPTCFLSYSWDDESHRSWVKELATRLRKDGVAVTLDRWHAVPGDQLPSFMESAVRESDFVLLVCTPAFKLRVDRRSGGVGYEGDIIAGEYFTGVDSRKFIPILRVGPWRDAAPSALLGKYYIDLSSDPYQEINYQDLLSMLLGTREKAPPIGAASTQSRPTDWAPLEAGSFALISQSNAAFQSLLVDLSLVMIKEFGDNPHSFTIVLRQEMRLKDGQSFPVIEVLGHQRIDNGASPQPDEACPCGLVSVRRRTVAGEGSGRGPRQFTM